MKKTRQKKNLVHVPERMAVGFHALDDTGRQHLPRGRTIENPIALVGKIRKAHPSMPVFTYDADHGFNCDERGSYDEASADLALKRTLEFFAEHLK